ncbi:MAG TPA: pentapeptide repeat-containing protein [Candidatus Acidoferrum sp.]|nr:pentapeptide repeat-containing protein [Candidatus Acidoferrum sp.]
MKTHVRKERPLPWKDRRLRAPRAWIVPFVAVDWIWEWVAYALSHWTFLEVLDYLETFSVLVAVIFYFSESGDRVKQRHYQAWQVVNTSQGKGGSGGRVEALQELNADHVALVGVDVSGAFLQGIKLEKARLLRANFSAADVRESRFIAADFTSADLRSANFRTSDLSRASLQGATLDDSDLTGADLSGADLAGASLVNADLTNADLRDIQWQHLAAIRNANIFGVRNAPAGFLDWAVKHGAQNTASTP